MVSPQSNFPPARGGFLFKALLVLVLLSVACAIAWVVLLPSLVASTIHSKTGFTVKIERLSVNPFTANAQVTGLVLQNPSGWPEADFIEVRQFKADLRLWSLISGPLVANDVVADIAHITLVKNRDGVLNTSAFTNGFSGTGSGSGQAGAPAQNGGKRQGFLIHRLSLKFDQLVYADYSRQPPQVRKYNINLNRQMTEVDSVTKIISPLTGSALGVLAGAFGGMSQKDADTLADAVDTLQTAGKKAGESLKNMFRSLDNKKP
jgi:uncharacterized protein involved in outer membrane biogenesis